MTHTRLLVDGMTCEACSTAVHEALRLPGVSQVDVSLETGVVDVAHAESVGVEVMVGAIEETGYEVREAQSP
jgi:copper chaperone CopZ